METIKNLIKENHPDGALYRILEKARLTNDYSQYVSLCRLRKKTGIDLPDNLKSKELKIAILGSATTDFLKQPLQLELETLGISSKIFIPAYNTYVSEMMAPDSSSVQFQPDVAVFLITPFSISTWPSPDHSIEEIASLAENICDHWLRLCESFHVNTNCDIIISNLHILPTRPTGNLGRKLPWEQNSFIRQVNETLAYKAPEYVHILDIDTLSSFHGVTRWFDIRFWHHSKQPVSFECIVPLVRNLSAIIGGLYGRTCKCVVLDLDNTLWGGVIGDDGLDGIKIGEGDAISESFKAFQEYLLNLKNRGVLLAVCSKNEEANALSPFEKLPEMILRREDFVSFKANWEGKPDNIKAIARDLNIGLESLLFVDDNPAEREHIRQVLPQVKVLELSDDPADYPLLLDQCAWLEPVRLTKEDREKTRQYRNKAQSEELLSTYSDYDSYLKSLEQYAVIHEFESIHLDRITQLINKTNQFNLTTKRLNRSEVESWLQRNDAITAYIRLTDRFGDNGIISVLAAHRVGTRLYIDLWLMSCRVFKRGVEHLLTNYLFEKCAEIGIEFVEGCYIPTQKNQLVSQHYENLGFRHIGTDDNDISRWEIKVTDYVPMPIQINILENKTP